MAEEVALNLGKFRRQSFTNADGTLTRDAAMELETLFKRVSGALGPIAASDVKVVPVAGISSDDVQAALQELDAEKADAATITGALATKQPLDATLTAVAGVATAANKLIYWTGVDVAAVTDFTAFARTLLDDPDAATMRATLGAGTVTSVSVATANGFGGSVATGTSTPTITLTTSVAGMLKGNGTGLVAAVAGTDYVAPGGALGTPSSGTLTNATGLPIATGVSGLAAGVATFLATPSSANLAAAVTNETGSGALVFANTPALVTPDIGAATGASLALTGGLTSSGTAGIGYAAGSGGSVTQATSKSTAVTLNKPNGQITMNAAALAAGASVSFTLNNSCITTSDRLIVHHAFGGTFMAYDVGFQCGVGFAQIGLRNASTVSLAEAVGIAFAVIKGVNA